MNRDEAKRLIEQHGIDWAFNHGIIQLGRHLPVQDLTHKSFGKLRVKYLDSANRIQGKPIQWICQCECGSTISVKGSQLRSGEVTSCGCVISY